MLKIVPDPPHHIHSLEAPLIQPTDCTLCAATVAHQAPLLQPKSPTSILIMASMHEMEALWVLLELALTKVPMPDGYGAVHRRPDMCCWAGSWRASPLPPEAGHGDADSETIRGIEQ